MPVTPRRPRSRSRSRSPSSPLSPLKLLNSFGRGWTEEKRLKATVWKKGGKTFSTVTGALEYAKSLASKKDSKAARSAATILMNMKRSRRSGQRRRRR